MNKKTLLLFNDVKQAFSQGFVFLITSDLVQHFPARGWTDEQIINELYLRYQEEGFFRVWCGYRIVELTNRPDLLIVVP